jgi:hypothetical protein
MRTRARRLEVRLLMTLATRNRPFCGVGIGIADVAPSVFYVCPLVSFLYYSLEFC